MKKLAAIFGSFTIIASLFSSPLEAHADPVGSSDAAQSGATTHLASSAATVPGSSLPGSSLIPRWDQFQLSSQVLEFFHNSSDEAYRAFFCFATEGSPTAFFHAATTQQTNPTKLAAWLHPTSTSRPEW